MHKSERCSYSFSDTFLRTAIGPPKQPITPVRAATMTMQIAVLGGAVLQDFRDGQRPRGGGEHPLPRQRKHVAALVPKLILEAPKLGPGQFGQPPDDLLYHPPPSPLV
jgi:hypothetical protein